MTFSRNRFDRFIYTWAKEVYFDADNRINLLCYFTQDKTMKSNLIQKEYDSYNLFKSSLLKEKY